MVIQSANRVPEADLPFLITFKKLIEGATPNDTQDLVGLIAKTIECHSRRWHHSMRSTHPFLDDSCQKIREELIKARKTERRPGDVSECRKRLHKRLRSLRKAY